MTSYYNLNHYVMSSKGTSFLAEVRLNKTLSFNGVVQTFLYCFSLAPSSSSRRNSDKMVDKHFSDKMLVFNSLGYVVESTNDGLKYLQSPVMTVDMGEPYLYAYQGEKGDCLNLDQAATDYSLHFANEHIYNVNSVSPDQYPIAYLLLRREDSNAVSLKKSRSVSFFAAP